MVELEWILTPMRPACGDLCLYNSVPCSVQTQDQNPASWEGNHILFYVFSKLRETILYWETIISLRFMSLYLGIEKRWKKTKFKVMWMTEMILSNVMGYIRLKQGARLDEMRWVGSNHPFIWELISLYYFFRSHIRKETHARHGGAHLQSHCAGGWGSRITTRLRPASSTYEVQG